MLLVIHAQQIGAANERNRATWGELLERGSKAKVYWAIDAPRWKQALYAALS